MNVDESEASVGGNVVVGAASGGGAVVAGVSTTSVCPRERRSTGTRAMSRTAAMAATKTTVGRRYQGRCGRTALGRTTAVESVAPIASSAVTVGRVSSRYSA